MTTVSGKDLAKYSDNFSSKVFEMKNAYIIKALGTESEHSEENIIKSDPTQEEVCEYAKEYKDSLSGPKEVGPDLHEAAIAWAEDNC